MPKKTKTSMNMQLMMRTAAVRTAEGQEPIFTEKHLKLTKGAGGTIVVLQLPSRLIRPGDYSVTLYKSGTDYSSRWDRILRLPGLDNCVRFGTREWD